MDHFSTWVSGGNGRCALRSRRTGREWRYRMTRQPKHDWERDEYATVHWERAEGEAGHYIGKVYTMDGRLYWEPDPGDWIEVDGWRQARDVFSYTMDCVKRLGMLHRQMAVIYTTCGRCGRELSDPRSVARGYGPECAKYMEEAANGG